MSRLKRAWLIKCTTPLFVSYLYASCQRGVLVPHLIATSITLLQPTSLYNLPPTSPYYRKHHLITTSITLLQPTSPYNVPPTSPYYRKHHLMTTSINLLQPTSSYNHQHHLITTCITSLITTAITFFHRFRQMSAWFYHS